MHIDYDYYDYLSEQDDRNRPRRKKLISSRAVVTCLVLIMLILGILGSVMSCSHNTLVKKHYSSKYQKPKSR